MSKIGQEVSVKVQWLLSGLLAAAALLPGAVSVPALISDHMLLQKNAPVRIWGKAAPDEAVTVRFRGQEARTSADANGRWQVFLRPMKPGSAADLTITGTNTLLVHDVLVGDVWIGSGQSNMEFPLSRADRATDEVMHAEFPQIRLFTVKRVVADQPLDDVQGHWSLCSPDEAKNFSAVLYFFGREIYQTQKIPVGLIHTSWGGTPAQSWTSAGMLKSNASLAYIQDEWTKTMDAYPAAKAKYDEANAKYKQEAAAAKADGKPVPTAPRAPTGPGSPNTPAGLYNAMIAPLTPYAIRGALWYQGEANASKDHAYPYRYLFASMIEDWRQQWGEGAFPFYLVQLANFRANPYWPLLRESQTEALNLRNTGMAVAIDVGNPTDIHPTNKQDVGHRLALWARADTYGEKIVYSGPLYRQAAMEGNAVRVYFDAVGAGLQAKNNALTGFAVAGADHQFYPAQAVIDGDTVVVSSDQVARPMAVRYAWQDDPAVSLFNADGLPASPFRSDLWMDAKMPKP